MRQTNTPDRLLYYAFQYNSYLVILTNRYIFSLEGNTPFETINYSFKDILEYVFFLLYTWVLY